MSRVKYIDLKDLKKKIEEVLAEVSRFDVEYIVMINKEPKVKIKAINGKNGKVVTLKTQEKDLEKFLE